MKILFVAKHGSGDNDDEGAVAHALRVLGHEVACVQEQRWKREKLLESYEADFCLFFKWPTVSELIETAKRMPCCFYYFDMVESVEGDLTLAARSQSRLQWMEDVIPHIVTGFCTDGDYVKKRGGPLVHLMQGFDERQAALLPASSTGTDLLFTGMVNHGQKRAQHIALLQHVYGDRFEVLGNRGPRGRIHSRELAEKFAATKIVIAPDGPNTDLYWSNRVYLVTGLGGFLLHPYCVGLADQYGSNIEWYHSREQCNRLIDWALKLPQKSRDSLREYGHIRTMSMHLYRHRCEEIVRIVKERM